jgi:hypothetical protein
MSYHESRVRYELSESPGSPNSVKLPVKRFLGAKGQTQNEDAPHWFALPISITGRTRQIRVAGLPVHAATER